MHRYTVPTRGYTDRPLSSLSTRELIAELAGAESELESTCNLFGRRALEIRVSEIENWIAIHNARSSRSLQGIDDDRLSDITEKFSEHETVQELVYEVRRLQAELSKLKGRDP